MTTRRPWELHAGNHVRWGGTVITVLHEPVLGGSVYHVAARRSDDGHQVDAELELNSEVEVADSQPPQIAVASYEDPCHAVGDENCDACGETGCPESRL